MTISSQEELAGMRKIGAIVATALRETIHALREGITTQALDHVGGQVLLDLGARAAPRLLYHFPGDLCISLNDEVAHGIPGPRPIRPGDLVNIDVSAEKDGFFADTGASIPFHCNDSRVLELCQCSSHALDSALQSARHGANLNAIGKAVEGQARRSGFQVIRNLGGHGVGRALHEEPSHLLNYYDPFCRQRFHRNMVVAIETFISEKARLVVDKGDGWTLVTPDGSRVAQYEHTVVITDSAPMVLTRL